ncbi:VanZ family protein [Clostridium tarantellae]|uniref:VanZ family protein n=1 Tax=Clostridium tarantellae TaxID=39493 RepID=A0A6I1MSW1_9CLOT|nr:VanZ family protein [Clostridium tarantellae]
MQNKKKLAWSMVILWMVMIFYMSHQPSDVSSEQSDKMVYLFNLIGLDLSSYFGELATLFIRKCAHFTEYMILYILVYNVIKYYVKSKSIYIYALVITFSYACTDEIHQLFVLGRSGEFKDVIIDTFGGTAGMLLVNLKNRLKK